MDLGPDAIFVGPEDDFESEDFVGWTMDDPEDCPAPPRPEVGAAFQVGKVHVGAGDDGGKREGDG